MLHFKIKNILLASAQRYPATWLEKHCGFGRTKARKLCNGTQDYIHLKDMSKICESLNCTPNDLLYWDNTKGTKLLPTHACITQLTPPDKNADWFSIFKQMPPEQIIELHQHAVNQLGKK